MPSNDLVALSGPPRSGKDSVADHLIKHYGYHRVAFADAIIAACAGGLGMSIDQWLQAPKDVRRPQLQGLGHNARWYDPLFWIKQLDQQLTAEGAYHEDGHCCHTHSCFPPWPVHSGRGHPCRIVITDLRYLNEAVWLREKGFVLIKLERPTEEIVDQMLVENPDADRAVLLGQLAAPSEHDLDAFHEWDWSFLSTKGHLNNKIEQVIGTLTLLFNGPSRAAIAAMCAREQQGLPPYE